jgi:hypothetical protein
MNILMDPRMEIDDRSDTFRILADELGESNRQLAAASGQNTKLVHALSEARHQIAALKGRGGWT